MKVTKSSTIFIWEGAQKHHVRAESEVGSSDPLRALEAVGFLMLSLSRAIWTLCFSILIQNGIKQKIRKSIIFFSSIVDQILGRGHLLPPPPPPVWIRHCSDQLLSTALSCINSFSYFTMCTPSANLEGSRPWLVLYMRNCFCCICFKIVDYQTKSNVFFTKCWKIIEICMCFFLLKVCFHDDYSRSFDHPQVRAAWILLGYPVVLHMRKCLSLNERPRVRFLLLQIWSIMTV